VHEWSLATALVQAAEEEARRRGASRVLSVAVTAGFRTGVVPELLERAFEAAREGTLLAGATLEVEVVPLRLRCRTCGAEEEEMTFLLVCPRCGGPEVEVQSGDGLVLRSLELEIPEG
jgi:hydrogenase nickel incorporation protein HypA/HybF